MGINLAFEGLTYAPFQQDMQQLHSRTLLEYLNIVNKKVISNCNTLTLTRGPQLNESLEQRRSLMSAVTQHGQSLERCVGLFKIQYFVPAHLTFKLREVRLLCKPVLDVLQVPLIRVHILVQLFPN